jgi:hypothetical protein
MKPLSYTPDAAIASAEELLAQLPNTLRGQHLLGSSEQSAQNPYPVAKKSAVGRMMDVGSYHHRLNPQLAPGG